MIEILFALTLVLMFLGLIVYMLKTDPFAKEM